MKNFLVGFLCGLALFLMAAAVTQPKKAIGITNNENMIYVLYDDGSVYANQAGVVDHNGWGKLKFNPAPWVNWSKGVSSNSVEPQPYEP